MTTVFIPAAMRNLTGGLEQVTATGRNVGQVIDDVDRRFPGFRDYLVTEGDLKASIAVSIDGEIGTGGLLDPVSESSQVYFVPALSGGIDKSCRVRRHRGRVI